MTVIGSIKRFYPGWGDKPAKLEKYLNQDIRPKLLNLRLSSDNSDIIRMR
jgi:hypothetical protein